VRKPRPSTCVLMSLETTESYTRWGSGATIASTARNKQSGTPIRSVPISVGNAVETGKYEPGRDLAFKISRIFGKNVEEVFLYEEARQVPDVSRGSSQ